VAPTGLPSAPQPVDFQRQTPLKASVHFVEHFQITSILPCCVRESSDLVPEFQQLDNLGRGREAAPYPSILNDEFSTVGITADLLQTVEIKQICRTMKEVILQ
jgi:hypothetical protein